MKTYNPYYKKGCDLLKFAPAFEPRTAPSGLLYPVFKEYNDALFYEGLDGSVKTAYEDRCHELADSATVQGHLRALKKAVPVGRFFSDTSEHVVIGFASMIHMPDALEFGRNPIMSRAGHVLSHFAKRDYGQGVKTGFLSSIGALSGKGSGACYVEGLPVSSNYVAASVAMRPTLFAHGLAHAWGTDDGVGFRVMHAAERGVDQRVPSKRKSTSATFTARYDVVEYNAYSHKQKYEVDYAVSSAPHTRSGVRSAVPIITAEKAIALYDAGDFDYVLTRMRTVSALYGLTDMEFLTMYVERARKVLAGPWPEQVNEVPFEWWMDIEGWTHPPSACCDFAVYFDAPRSSPGKFRRMSACVDIERWAQNTSVTDPSVDGIRGAGLCAWVFQLPAGQTRRSLVWSTTAADRLGSKFEDVLDAELGSEQLPTLKAVDARNAKESVVNPSLNWRVCMFQSANYPKTAGYGNPTLTITVEVQLEGETSVWALKQASFNGHTFTDPAALQNALTEHGSDPVVYKFRVVTPLVHELPESQAHDWLLGVCPAVASIRRVLTGVANGVSKNDGFVEVQNCMAMYSPFDVNGCRGYRYEETGPVLNEHLLMQTMSVGVTTERFVVELATGGIPHCVPIVSKKKKIAS